MKKTFFFFFLGLVLCFFHLVGSADASVKTPPQLQEEYLYSRKIAEQNPSSAEYVFNYAMSCAYTGKVDEGLTALKKVDSIDGNYAQKMAPIYKNRSLASRENWKDRFYYAFAVYALSLKRQDNITREEKKKYQDEAVAQFRAVTGILGDKNFVTAWAYGYMGAICGEQEKFDEALGYLKKAIKIEPDGIPLHMALGYGYMKRGNWVGFVGEMLTVGRLKGEEEKLNNKGATDEQIDF